MKLCSKCNTKPAVVFLTRIEGEKSFPEGYCLSCAKELNIGPINDMLKQLNINDENIDEVTNEMMETMDGIIGEDGQIDAQALNEKMEEILPGGAATFPFLNNLFGQQAQEGEHIVAEEVDENKSKEKKKKQKKTNKHKFLDGYCTNLTERAREGAIAGAPAIR